MFSQNTKQPSLYTFRISREFRVLLMPRKNKPQNPLTIRTNADSGAKCKKRKKRGVKCEKSDAKYLAIHFLFFMIVFAYFTTSV